MAEVELLGTPCKWIIIIISYGETVLYYHHQVLYDIKNVFHHRGVEQVSYGEYQPFFDLLRNIHKQNFIQ